MVTHYFHSLQNIIQVLGWCKGHRVPAPSHCRLGHSRCFCVLLAQNADSTSSRTSSSASTSCESLSCHEHLLLWVLQHVCEQRSGGKRGCEPWQGSGGQGRVVRIQRPKPRDNVILSDLPWTPWCWEQPDVLLILMARQGKTASMRAHPPHLACPSTVDAFIVQYSGQ
jgi:hypothetical protein